MKEFLSFLLYICGHLISYPMVYLDIGWLYPAYHYLMSKSVDYDSNGRFWVIIVPNEDDEEAE